MLLKWTKANAIEVVGHGQVAEGETIDMDDGVGQVLLAGDGWEEASKPAQPKKRTAKPAAERE